MQPKRTFGFSLFILVIAYWFGAVTTIADLSSLNKNNQLSDCFLEKNFPSFRKENIPT